MRLIKLIKMFGLAAIAAVAAMAFLGASTASATQDTLLCSNNTELLRPTAADCSVVQRIHLVSVEGLDPSTSHGLFLGSTLTVRCNVLLVAESEQTLAVAGTSLSFNKNVNLGYSNCLSGFHVLVLKHGHVLVLKTGPELAQITMIGFEINILGNGLNCDYDLSGEGHGLTGPEGKGHTTYTKASINLLFKLGGFIPCQTPGVLDLLFQSLTPLYIRS
jgi:hypothetical protein